MKIKDRLHRAFSLVVLSVLSATGIVILTLTRSSAESALDKELSQTSFLIYKIVQNVFDLNEKMLLGNLKLLESNIRTVGLDESVMIHSDAEHYITRLTDYVEVPALTINDRVAFGDNDLVDTVAGISGGNVSVLQLFPQGLLQIATNIRRPDGRRATQLYYPNDDKITMAIRAGQTYIGKAFEMNEWHIVAYRPVFYDGKPIGAIHAGIKPDIDDLRKHILDIRIGRTGCPYIVDTEGILVISAHDENENVYHLPYIKKMVDSRSDGMVSYRDGARWPDSGDETIAYYRYLPAMEWIVVTGSLKREFYSDQEIITWIIVLSMIIAFGAAVLVSLQVSDNLTKSIQFLTDSMNAVKDLRFDFGDFAAVERIKRRLKESSAAEDEIVVMTEAYYKMLDELEGAQRQIISKHRRFRQIEIAKKVGSMLSDDFETLQGYEVAARVAPSDEAAGQYFDRTAGPYGQSWYLIGEAASRSAAAGLIMMMAQSAISSITRSIPDASGVEIAEMMNRFLIDGLRVRADLEAIRSVSIVVTRPDGTFEYAGMDDHVLVYRGAEGRCFEVATEPAGMPGKGGSPGVRVLGLGMEPSDLLVCGYAVDRRRPGDAAGRAWMAELVEEFAAERLEDIATKTHAAMNGDRGAGLASSTAVFIRKH
ncbi:MAG: hypothetical protein CVV47_08170 [Spirochaetae bacterium HGW-Spirochaetae-3]|jgi:hypothetical protein|nr:MAG: hypothetical protein CVV47_08170 [Spirochaetae bacterium HGW-Spirochaetae-3]